jgi:hypothetical protein
MTTAPDAGPAAAGPVESRAAQPARPASRTGWAAYLPGVAGAGYLVAWVAGLAAWPNNLPLNATAGQTAAAYAAHPAQAAVQYLLVEGLAGLLLGVVLGCALLPRLRGGVRLPAAAAALLAVAALGTSLAQCVLGLVLTGAADAGDVSRCGELASLVNRLDGVKMLAIAAVALLLAAPARPASALPRWLRALAVPLAAALAASGYAYLTLSQPLAWTAYVSGTLLLLWVTGLGIALAVSRRSGGSVSGRGGGPGRGR